MKPRARLHLLLLFLGLTATPLLFAMPNAPGPARILLIPLDSRPPCLQWPVLLGRVADAEVITPPDSLLGRFTAPGDPEGIATWIDRQDWDEIDAVIVSLDMLAYGGLVASRVHDVKKENALARLELLEQIRRRHPRVPLYGFNIIMRLAPTADGSNDAWREALARWAESAPDSETDPEAAREVARLEEIIPGEVLAGYKRARERNLAVNRAAIEMVRTGALDYLILAQDDAHPKGVHVADRVALLESIGKEGLEKQVAVQPGADEVAMLLLARILTNRFESHPGIHPVFSSEKGRTSVAPYEDRPLHETVSRHIAAAGGRETSLDEADLLFYVFASRHDPGAAEPFAGKIAKEVREGRRVIVADIDTRGDVQGADVEFTEAMRRRKVFPRLFGYASWNTAGNTIGTALPQGILHALAAGRPTGSGDDRDRRVNEAQLTFLLQRLINDYLYHSLIRPGINRIDAREQGMNPMRLSPRETRLLEETILTRIRPLTEEIWQDFADCGPPSGLSDFKLTLPWGRTFEAQFDFLLTTSRTAADRP